MSFKTDLARWTGLASALVCLLLTSAAATSLDGRSHSWRTEPGVSPPSYAVTEPTESDLNVDTIALVCGETAYGRTLEIDLYLVGSGPLLPNGADPRWLKERPSVEIAVDGRRFRANILFADGYVVVANAFDHRWPTLTASLQDAMQNGRSMVIRFDLLEEGGDGTSRFDSQLVIDLQAGQPSIAAVRQCVSPNAHAAVR
jgi:prepilin-type processing-associated H-X9-DG protein